MGRSIERMPQRQDVRVGDAERERAAERLTRHFAAGRLTTGELEERLEAAAGARTRTDLLRVEHDLPRLRHARGRRRSRRRRIAIPVLAWQLTWILPVAASWAAEAL